MAIMLSYSSAVFFMNRTKIILERTDRYADLSRLHSVMADFYLYSFPNYSKAEVHIIEAEKLALKANDSDIYVFARMKRGILFEKKKLFINALQVYKEVYDY